MAELARSTIIRQSHSVVLVEDTNVVNSLPDVFTTEFAVVFLLTSGRVEMLYDGHLQTIQPNDLFVFYPNYEIRKVSVSSDFSFRAVCLKNDFISTLTTKEGSVAEVMLMLSQRTNLAISAESVDSFLRYYELIKLKLSQPETINRGRKIVLLTTSFLCDAMDYVTDGDFDKLIGFTSTDSLFRRFLQLMSDIKPKPRYVDDYAQMLNVTPKYLSAICKKKTGMTAIKFINKAVLKDIITLLHDDTKSIKQISDELGFPSQSFLGTFLKKHAGMSPLQYRTGSLVSGSKRGSAKKGV